MQEFEDVEEAEGDAGEGEEFEEDEEGGEAPEYAALVVSAQHCCGGEGPLTTLSALTTTPWPGLCVDALTDSPTKMRCPRVSQNQLVEVSMCVPTANISVPPRVCALQGADPLEDDDEEYEEEEEGDDDEEEEEAEAGPSGTHAWG